MTFLSTTTPVASLDSTCKTTGMQSPSLLLFSTTDLDQARTLVSQTIKPHRLCLSRSGNRLDARMHYAQLGSLSLSRLRYGAGVRIDRSLPLEDFFLLQIPLAGAAQVRSGTRNVESDPAMATVLSPDDEVGMEWSDDCDQLMLRIARPLLERCLTSHLGHAPEKALRFDLALPWRAQDAWPAFATYLAHCADSFPDMVQHPLLVAQLEQTAACLLLTGHRHNHSDAAPAKRGPILPRHVRRAQEYLQAHAHEPVNVQQLAEVVNVSARSLYSGFKEFLGVSPMHYLRDLRMERVRLELLAAQDASVTNVALRWGFMHLGRFSGDYRQRYGETPSQTLRRS
jgi:AraC-like DNA-binding protein